MEDKYQNEAVLHELGPALVLAGPGSGKTTVITHHVCHLIDSGVSPENILVITFTKAAANEMQSRFKKLKPCLANRVSFGTFHSFFYRMIYEYNSTNKKIISKENREKLLIDIAGSLDNAFELSNYISKYKSFISYAYNKSLNDSDAQVYNEWVSIYKDELSKRNFMDFDDILCTFYNMVKENQQIRIKLKNRFKYICIDEFQDINEIQYESIKLITGLSGNVFCVGDDDQSIYGFRGGSYETMQKFVSEFENVKIIELQTNYRSFPDIVLNANRLIEKNTGRLKRKQQRAFHKSDDKHFFFNIFDSVESEYEALIYDINAAGERGIKQAVLFRTNKEVNDFMAKCISLDHDEIKLNIQNDVIDIIENFILYTTCKSIKSLQFILNSLNVFSLSDMSNSSCIILQDYISKYKGTRLCDSLYVLDRHLKLLDILHPYAYISYLKNVCGYEEKLIKKYGVENANIISDCFNKFIKITEDIQDIKELLIYTKELRSQKNAVNMADEIYVSTYHQTKGLEFDAVFLPDLYEGRVPSPLANEECKIEEERRLLFVAMTRAKKELHMYTIKNEESGGLLPSRFIKDIIY